MSYRQADVRCPFYHRDDGRRRITCEGLRKDSTVIVSFLRRIDYERQMLCCCGQYENCVLYRMINAKYTEK